MHNKGNLLLFFLIVSFLFFMYYFINIFSYLDPLGRCYISISGDVSAGNETTIHQAIKSIKKEDKESYANLCKHIRKINEQPCIAAAGQVDSKEFYAGIKKEGCFVKGSKAIYIRPNKDEGAEIISERAETIKKLAEISSEYWQNQKEK